MSFMDAMKAANMNMGTVESPDFHACYLSMKDGYFIITGAQAGTYKFEKKDIVEFGILCSGGNWIKYKIRFKDGKCGIITSVVSVGQNGTNVKMPPIERFFGDFLFCDNSKSTVINVPINKNVINENEEIIKNDIVEEKTTSKEIDLESHKNDTKTEENNAFESVDKVKDNILEELDIIEDISSENNENSLGEKNDLIAKNKDDLIEEKITSEETSLESQKSSEESLDSVINTDMETEEDLDEQLAILLEEQKYLSMLDLKEKENLENINKSKKKKTR